MGASETVMFGVEFVQGLVGRIALVGVVSAGFWNAVYFALKAVMPKSTGRKLHNNDGSGVATAPVETNTNSGEGALRAVTIVYAASICILAAVSNLWIGPWAYSSVGEENTPLQTLTLQLSLGYFIFDLSWSLSAGGETLLLCAHHAASIGAVLAGLVLGASGSELVGSLFGAEITNIPLQIRWFMLEAGLKGTQKMMYADLCFAITFLICRVLWAPTLLYVVILSNKPHWAIKLGGTALQLISWAWASVVWGKLANSIKTAGSKDSAPSAQKKES